MQNKYPEWIDEFAKARFESSSTSGSVSWGPVDSFTLPKFYEDAFANKLSQAIDILKQKGISKEKVADSFATASCLRTGLSFLTADYSWTKKKDKEKFRKIFDYLVDLLKVRMREDIFCCHFNLAHTKEEVEEILKKVQWKEGSVDEARALGRLLTSLASLAFALFGDLYPQNSNEVYGPYDTFKKFGKDSILILRHFTNIKPVELWPNTKDYRYSDVKIYLIYQDIDYEVRFIGMHATSKGDLIRGLRKYVVEVDGKWQNNLRDIDNLTEYFSCLAVEQSKILEGLNLEEIKVKGLEWVGYQFKGMFELAGMDWRPTQDMLEKVKGVQVATRMEPHKPPTWEQFNKSKHNDYFALKDLYS